MNNEYSQIVLEGSDLIGKSTISKYLGKVFGNVRDRDMNITDNVLIGSELRPSHINKICDYIQERPNELFVFLTVPLDHAENVLGTRLAARKAAGKSDEFDEHTVAYNKSYKEIVTELKFRCIKNVLEVNVDEFRNPYAVVGHIGKTVLYHIIDKIEFNLE